MIPVNIQMVSRMPDIPVQSNETTIENKLTKLVIKVKKGVNLEKNIQKIRTFKKEQGITNDNIKAILTYNGFDIKEIKKIVNSIWNQGDPLSREEAEKMLKYTPIECWLLRYGSAEKEYIITKKEGKDNYKHIKNLQQQETSVDNIIKGFSCHYPFKNILLSSNVLSDNIYTYGNLSKTESEQKLENSPTGTWLLRYSDKENDFVITAKKNDDSIIHHNLTALNKRHTLSGYLDQVKKKVSPKKNSIKLQHLGKISPELRTHRQTEAQIMPLYVNELAVSSTPQDFTKISCTQYNELMNSYVVEKQDQKLDIDGKPLFINTTLPDNAVKIYQVVHGKEGFLGEGSYKKAKYMVDIETGEKLVKGKFKDFTPAEIHQKFPEMLAILKKTKGMPHIASGHFAIMKSAIENDYAVIMSPFAKSDLHKQIIGGKLSQETKMKYVRQLLTGLAVLHDAKIAHRDIKPENINIIDGDAYLADFDIATCKNKPICCGTPIFFAPEIAQEKYQSINDLLKGDVFALGMSFFQLFNGHHLWSDDFMSDNSWNQLKLEFYNQNEKDWIKEYPEPLPKTIEHLVWMMMHHNPAKRLTPREALAELDILETNQKTITT